MQAKGRMRDGLYMMPPHRAEDPTGSAFKANVARGYIIDEFLAVKRY